MSRKQSTVAALIGIVLSSSALAELPDPSILTRYGITTDQLPAARAGQSVEAAPPRSRFEIQPEKPGVSISLGVAKRPDATGNISIDHSMQQDHERCRRLQGDSLRRKGEMIDCDAGALAPSVGKGFSR
jgi:hypothetical protein